MPKKKKDILLEKREALLMKQNAIIQKAKEEATEGVQRDLTPEELVEFNSITEQLENNRSQVKALEQIEENERAVAEKAMRKKDRGNRKSDEANLLDNYSLIRAAQISSTGRFDGAEGEVHQEAEKIARDCNLPVDGKGILILPGVLSRGSVTTDPANAGNLIPTTLQSIREGYKPKLIVDGLGVDRMDNLVGVSEVPLEDLQATTGWVGETGNSTEVNVATRKESLTPKGIRTKISTSYLQAASAGSAQMNARLAAALMRGEANQLNSTLILGGGSVNEPTGVLADADVVTIPIGTDGGALTRAIITKLKNSPPMNDANFAGSHAFITTPGVRDFAENVKIDTGSGRFLWPENSDNTLHGHPAFTTSLCPSNLTKGAGADLHAMIFGAWSQMVMAGWAVRSLFVNPYKDDDKVWTQLVSFYDMAVLNPKAFAKVVDIDIS